MLDLNSDDVRDYGEALAPFYDFNALGTSTVTVNEINFVTGYKGKRYDVVFEVHETDCEEIQAGNEYRVMLKLWEDPVKQTFTAREMVNIVHSILGGEVQDNNKALKELQKEVPQNVVTLRQTSKGYKKKDGTEGKVTVRSWAQVSDD